MNKTKPAQPPVKKEALREARRRRMAADTMVFLAAVKRTFG
jgi:hypothetical protein